MKKLVIDIETVGTPWEEHDPYVREYLIKGMSEAEAEEEKRRGALSPFTGKIVAIGVVNAETGRSCAMYEVPGQTDVITRKDGNRTMISGTERQILEKFWEFLDREDRFISFNGRQFDGHQDMNEWLNTELQLVGRSAPSSSGSAPAASSSSSSAPATSGSASAKPVDAGKAEAGR